MRLLLCCGWLVMLGLLLIEPRGVWKRPRRAAERQRVCARDVLRCFLMMQQRPWLAVYGDSVARGIFFDLVELFNTTDAAPRHGCAFFPSGAPAHPGHSANFSDGCQVVDRRPPSYRPKCGAFELITARSLHSPRRLTDRMSDPRLGQQPVTLLPANTVAPFAPLSEHAMGRRLRLSYRLKTFAWEESMDRNWLDALRRSPRLPDVIVLSFGLWDMQYPPPRASLGGATAFNASLWTFLEELHQALLDARQQLDQVQTMAATRAPDKEDGSSNGAIDSGQLLIGASTALRGHNTQPLIVWLSVGAISAGALPKWKRPLMTSEFSRAYNELAMPAFAKYGISVIDTFTESSNHPELSPDGVHYPGDVSRYHSLKLIEQILPRCLTLGPIRRPG